LKHGLSQIVNPLLIAIGLILQMSYLH
jgi:hypothetical protein